MDPQAQQQGDQRGGETRRLSRAPGERYAPPAGTGVTPAQPSRSVRRARGIGVAVGAALVTLVLTTFDIGPGLLAVGAATGWLVGLALGWGGAASAVGAVGAGAQRGLGAGVLAAFAMVTGLLFDGLRSLAEGGVLPPAVYAWERFGVLAVLVPLVALVFGWWRGR